MSSIKLESLIREFPEEAAALSRLECQLQRLQTSPSGKAKELTLERFYELTTPSSRQVLLSILARLCQHGILERLVRVESPMGGGIQDFTSVTEVPDEIIDWHDGRPLVVTPEHLRLIYKVHPVSAR